MKLVTADFREEDVKTLNLVVEALKKHDPQVNLKKYLKLCVVQYTDAVLKNLQEEAKNGQVHSSKREDRIESGTDTGEGTTSETFNPTE